MRIIAGAKALYRPLLSAAATRLGVEFVPQLDAGDIAMPARASPSPAGRGAAFAETIARLSTLPGADKPDTDRPGTGIVPRNQGYGRHGCQMGRCDQLNRDIAPTTARFQNV